LRKRAKERGREAEREGETERGRERYLEEESRAFCEAYFREVGDALVVHLSRATPLLPIYLSNATPLVHLLHPTTVTLYFTLTEWFRV
jgi:hypothetical protein